MKDAEYLVQLLDEAFRGPSWHGPTLLGSIRGVKPELALWKPGPDRHSIWDLVLHTAYWKYTVVRRLTGAARGSFPRAPSNFPAVPARADSKALKADLALLQDQHDQLVRAVRSLPDPAFSRRQASSRWTNASMIRGVAAHDVYHAGQIQLLKRLWRNVP